MRSSRGTLWATRLNENMLSYPPTEVREKELLVDVTRECTSCSVEAPIYIDLAPGFPPLPVGLTRQPVTVWTFSDGSVMVFTDFEGMRVFRDCVPASISEAE